MAEFCMPSLGADMDEGVLAEWLVKPGDNISRGQIVAVIETQKGAIDVEIFDDGVILELLVAEDTTVPVGTALALYVRPGEDEDEVRARASGPAPVEAEAEATAVEPEAEATAVEAASASERARARVSPRARKLARELGVELDQLDQLVGTGPRGSITGDDVQAVAGAGARARPAAPDRQSMRQAIAAAMTRSKAEIPHYYLAHTVDFEPALAWLEAYNRSVAIEARMLPVALWVRTLALALTRHRELNGHWRSGAFVASPSIHVGLAVSLRGGGLVNPALRDADQGSLEQLAARIRELSGRARRNALRASELGAATVTLTSLGDRGVDTLYPIIEPPQVAIIGVGTPRLRPWVVDGAVVPRRLVELSLSADHRVSDGHAGARFLQTLAKLVQAPEQLRSEQA